MPHYPDFFSAHPLSSCTFKSYAKTVSSNNIKGEDQIRRLLQQYKEDLTWAMNKFTDRNEKRALGKLKKEVMDIADTTLREILKDVTCSSVTPTVNYNFHGSSLGTVHGDVNVTASSLDTVIGNKQDAKDTDDYFYVQNVSASSP
ncbi:hypothetical protein DFQ28_000769 [Apophysomyces sp. BC1034]|nr:hypothetical protein DFQ29_000509 [Apophysomyces sp. BC1021]KAG0183840.1 hypothetical protein DFQ28_000769 [Apophysomyces sp. BC1034]